MHKIKVLAFAETGVDRRARERLALRRGRPALLFNHTADRPDLARKLLRLRYPRKLPTVLSPDEAARLLAATTCLKHRAGLSVARGAGLRVAEVASLKVGDISSDRMLIPLRHLRCQGRAWQGRPQPPRPALAQPAGPRARLVAAEAA